MTLRERPFRLATSSFQNFRVSGLQKRGCEDAAEAEGREGPHGRLTVGNYRRRQVATSCV